MEEAPILSVIICCYNSEFRISNTLNHLNSQITNLNFEIILVDNNCNDNTINIAYSLWNKLDSKIPLKIISEKKPGLSNARKCGVLAAKGELIIFCDDDNWLEYNYIEIATKIMKSNLEIGALGGRSYSVFDSVEPYWFSSYQASYAIGVQSLDSGDITARGFLWGAGLILRRKNLINLYDAGFKSICNGRNGQVLSAGDDSEICKWHILIGLKLWYDERLVFGHFIPENRLTKDYLKKMNLGFIESSIILDKYDEAVRYFFYENNFYKKINQLIISILKFIINRKDFNKTRLILQELFPSNVFFIYDIDYYNIINSRKVFLSQNKLRN